MDLKLSIFLVLIIGVCFNGASPIPGGKHNVHHRIHVPTKLHKVYITKVVKVPEHHHHHHYIKKDHHDHEHEFEAELLDHNTFDRTDLSDHFGAETSHEDVKPAIKITKPLKRKNRTPSLSEARKRRLRKHILLRYYGRE